MPTVPPRRGSEPCSRCCRIEPGAAEVTVEDWDTGEALVVSLDGKLSAAANAELLYKKARKQRRAADSVAPLLAAAEQQVGSPSSPLANTRAHDALPVVVPYPKRRL